MKKTIFIALLAACSFGSSLIAEEVNGVVFTLREDNKKWKVGNEGTVEGQDIVQYIPEGESVNNWTELFTVQTIKEARLDPQNIFNLLLRELHKIGPGNMVEHHTISNNEKGLLAEWWIKADSPIAQHEWIRIFNAGNSTVILRFTTKKTENLGDIEKVWLPILSDAYLKNVQGARLEG